MDHLQDQGSFESKSEEVMGPSRDPWCRVSLEGAQGLKDGRVGREWSRRWSRRRSKGLARITSRVLVLKRLDDLRGDLHDG
jgi:hypothetical protein